LSDVQAGAVPFDHPVHCKPMAKGMNAWPSRAGALANACTVNQAGERVPAGPIAEVITLLGDEESIGERIVAQALAVGRILREVLSAGGMQRNQSDLRNLVWITWRCGWPSPNRTSCTFKRSASPTRKPQLANSPIKAT
jgi:hypothetical protein